MWFSDRSRTIATALQSLASPLGAGFGALTGPLSKSSASLSAHPEIELELIVQQWCSPRVHLVSLGLQSVDNVSSSNPTIDYAEQALIIAIVFTVVSLPIFFIPKEPPTPPSAVAAAQRLGVRDGAKSLFKNRP